MVYQGDAIQYIYETPDILHGILQEEQNILRESTAFLENRKIPEIYLTGSGSSYNSALVPDRKIRLNPSFRQF